MPRKTVATLFREFEAAVVAMNAVPPAKSVTDSTAQFEAAVDAAGKLAWRIVKAPADTVGQMLLKIRVAGWCADVQPLAKLDNWRPGGLSMTHEAFYALASLREDLRKLPQGCHTPPGRD